MSTKVIIERKFKEGPNPEILRIINEIRIKALKTKGYIGGETIVNVDDDREVIVLSAWGSVDDWKTWYATEEWKDLEKELIPYLDGPIKTRIFIPLTDAEKKPSAK